MRYCSSWSVPGIIRSAKLGLDIGVGGRKGRVDDDDDDAQNVGNETRERKKLKKQSLRGW